MNLFCPVLCPLALWSGEPGRKADRHVWGHCCKAGVVASCVAASIQLTLSYIHDAGWCQKGISEQFLTAHPALLIMAWLLSSPRLSGARSDSINQLDTSRGGCCCAGAAMRYRSFLPAGSEGAAASGTAPAPPCFSRASCCAKASAALCRCTASCASSSAPTWTRTSEVESRKVSGIENFESAYGKLNHMMRSTH